MSVPHGWDAKFKFTQDVVQDMLNNPMLLRWYSQNADRAAHPKMAQIPIGTDMHGSRMPNTRGGSRLLMITILRIHVF